MEQPVSTNGSIFTRKNVILAGRGTISRALPSTVLIAGLLGSLRSGNTGLCRRPGQDYSHDATAAAGPVGNVNASAMGLRDLARQHESNAASAGFGGVKGSKYVRRIQKARALIFDCERDFLRVCIPTNDDSILLGCRLGLLAPPSSLSPERHRQHSESG